MEPPLDRRKLPDRRSCPTTLWSALRSRGRRTGFRRAGEGHQVYVDSLSWRVVTLAAFVCVCSHLDALLTLRYLQDGGSEANPLLSLILTHSPSLFLPFKIGITGVAVWLLAAHQQWPLAARGLQGLTLGYGVVLVYHLVLCLRWV